MAFEETGTFTACPTCGHMIRVKKDQDGEHSVTCRKCVLNGVGRDENEAVRNFQMAGKPRS